MSDNTVKIGEGDEVFARVLSLRLARMAARVGVGPVPDPDKVRGGILVYTGGPNDPVYDLLDVLDEIINRLEGP